MVQCRLDNSVRCRLDDNSVGILLRLPYRLTMHRGVCTIIIALNVPPIVFVDRALGLGLVLPDSFPFPIQLFLICCLLKSGQASVTLLSQEIKLVVTMSAINHTFRIRVPRCFTTRGACSLFAILYVSQRSCIFVNALV